MLRKVLSVGAVISGGVIASNAGCQLNASNPTVAAGRLSFYQWESKTVYVKNTDTIITAYNDDEGFSVFFPGGISCPPFPGASLYCPITPSLTVTGWVGQTFMGYSVLSNAGQNLNYAVGPWTLHAPIEPIAPFACMSPPCPLILRGDPGLATNDQRVLYTNLAYTDFDDFRNIPSVTCGSSAVERGPDAVAVSIDETGTGNNFGRPFVAAKFDETTQHFFGDQPSVSMFGDTAVIALDQACGAGRIWISTTDHSGVAAPWELAPIALFLPVGAADDLAHPIIKLVSPTLAYLAYEEFFATGPASEGINAVVVRLQRTAVHMNDWMPTVVFQHDGSAMSDAAPGAGGLSWVDFIPIGFDVGNGGTELHLVTRSSVISNGPADIFYDHCQVDNTLTNCDTSLNPNAWGPSERFPMTAISRGERFQPWVTADPTPGHHFAAVSYYQQTAPGGDQFFVMGVTVGSDATQGHTPHPIGYHDANGIVGAFTPCPTPGGTAGTSRFGDYESTTFTPYVNLLFTTDHVEPTWVSTFAKSDQCLGGGTDNEAHIESSAW